MRPWQHVLEPVSGYIAIAENLLGESIAGFDRVWNFGPDAAGDVEVETAKLAAEIWETPAQVQFDVADGPVPHEAGLLRLDGTLARVSLDCCQKDLIVVSSTSLQVLSDALLQI